MSTKAFPATLLVAASAATAVQLPHREMHHLPPRDTTSGSWDENQQSLGFILIVLQAGEELPLGKALVLHVPKIKLKH